MPSPTNIPLFSPDAIASALDFCVTMYGEDSQQAQDVCTHINADANLTAEEFDSLSQKHQDLLTRVCGFTPPS